MLFVYPKFIESAGIRLELTPGEVYIEFQQDCSPEQVKIFTGEYGFQLVKVEENMMYPHQFSSGSVNRCWMQEDEKGGLARIINSVVFDERVRSTSPVYHRPDLYFQKTGFTFSNQLLVRFQTYVSDSENYTILHFGCFLHYSIILPFSLYYHLCLFQDKIGLSNLQYQ